MRYFVEFAYKGTRYHGSQVQPNGTTVQQVMQDAMATILRHPVELTFAGRTDAGVHAAQMYAHWDSESPVSPTLADRLNRLLPEDIAVYRIFAVADDLHARFSATSRTYEYRITKRKDPFMSYTRTRITTPLDYAAMNEAAQHLLGTHDFASFCKVHTDVKTTLCTVTEAYWREEENGAIFTITADRFLRNMVRAVVGTLFDIGRGKITLKQFDDILNACNRQAAGQSAPPEGLFLVRVTYPFG